MAREAHDATSVLECLTGLLERVPGQLPRTLTFDQGREMARRAELSVKPSIEIFFAEPHHRFERPRRRPSTAFFAARSPRARTSLSTASPTSMPKSPHTTMPRQNLHWRSAESATVLCYCNASLRRYPMHFDGVVF